MAGEIDPKTGLPIGTKAAEPVDPVTGKKPDAGTAEDKDKQIAGLIKEVQTDRAERKELKEQVATMQAELAERDRQLVLAQEDAANKPQPGPEVADADWLNAGQTRQFVSERLAENQKDTLTKVSQGVAVLEDRVWKLTKKEAQRTYSKETVGEELSFDKVYAKTVEMAKKDPVLADQILRAPDPADAAYRVGLTHTDIQTYLKSQGATELANKLSKPTPKTPTSKGGAPSAITGLPIDQMVQVPLDQLLAEAKKG